MSFERFKYNVTNKITFDTVFDSLVKMLNIFFERESTHHIYEPLVLDLMHYLLLHFNPTLETGEKKIRNLSKNTTQKIVGIIDSDLPEIKSLFQHSDQKLFNDWLKTRFE